MDVLIHEPTENIDGTSINDLHSVVVFIMDRFPSEPDRMESFKASSPQGGGAHVIDLAGFIGTVTIQAKAYNFSGTSGFVSEIEVKLEATTPATPGLST